MQWADLQVGRQTPWLRTRSFHVIVRIMYIMLNTIFKKIARSGRQDYQALSSLPPRSITITTANVLAPAMAMPRGSKL
jgi:hypothetical protein